MGLLWRKCRTRHLALLNLTQLTLVYQSSLLTVYRPYQHYGQPFWQVQNSQHVHYRTACTELRWSFIEKTKVLPLVLPALFACSSHWYTCARKVTFTDLLCQSWILKLHNMTSFLQPEKVTHKKAGKHGTELRCHVTDVTSGFRAQMTWGVPTTCGNHLFYFLFLLRHIKLKLTLVTHFVAKKT